MKCTKINTKNVKEKRCQKVKYKTKKILLIQSILLCQELNKMQSKYYDIK